MRVRSHTSMMCAAVLAATCCASTALAETPVQTQDVLDMFTQRERLRTEQLWQRSYTQPIVSPAFDARSQERQLWQSQWWLQHRKEQQPAWEIPYCQPPYYLPPPPFRQCPNLLLQ